MLAFGITQNVLYMMYQPAQESQLVSFVLRQDVNIRIQSVLPRLAPVCQHLMIVISSEEMLYIQLQLVLGVTVHALNLTLQLQMPQLVLVILVEHMNGVDRLAKLVHQALK
ncbi:hypothetical protein FGO68_gene13207 [Halteria grandinella]|uniref:Uncharacterized protein n=1 Tax=Halteria grandinella TaxID=5974 RepID=A0A8J8N9U4_HALGN|nr:hypothetical protein FGO68_gene13207 [Halteria grandinella]